MRNVDMGLVIVRITVGLIFFAHGLAKFQGGIGNTAQYFESLGIPGTVASVVASVELIGGIALIAGLGTRVVTILLALIMVGAIYFVHLPQGLLRSEAGPGYELNLILMAACILLALAGSNYFAIDNLVKKTKATSTTLGMWFQEKR